MINQSIQVMINQSIQAMINQSIQVIASDMLTPSGNFGLQGHGSAQERSFKFWGVLKILWWKYWWWDKIWDDQGQFIAISKRSDGFAWQQTRGGECSIDFALAEYVFYISDVIDHVTAAGSCSDGDVLIFSTSKLGTYRWGSPFFILILIKNTRIKQTAAKMSNSIILVS